MPVSHLVQTTIDDLETIADIPERVRTCLEHIAHYDKADATALVQACEGWIAEVDVVKTRVHLRGLLSRHAARYGVK